MIQKGKTKFNKRIGKGQPEKAQIHPTKSFSWLMGH